MPWADPNHNVLADIRFWVAYYAHHDPVNPYAEGPKCPGCAYCT